MVRIGVIHIKRLMGILMCIAMLLAAIGIIAKAMELIKIVESEEAVPGLNVDMPGEPESVIVVKSAGINTNPVSVKSYDIIEEDEHDPAYDAGESIKIEIAGIKLENVPKTAVPKVLIYHTHTYEAYEQDPDDLYELAHGAKWRTKNPDHNIIRVGAELTKLLEGYGFQVVHDITEFEPPRLGTAYVRSLEMLEERIARGEEYDMLIDMHRDAFSKSSWTPASINLDGGDKARLMFLVGTGEDGFIEKPNWQENYALVAQMIDYLQAIDPQLCKDANVKTQRYNQHVSTRSVLVEVGHCENTLEQALQSMEYLAAAINHVLKD
ncbi:MAG: stage II sporulation protein P [Christensenellales bacterium]